MAPVFGGVLKDVLEQNSIPVLSNSSMGAGMAMRAGSMFERTELYVRYDDLERASEMVGGLLDPSEVPGPESGE